MREVHTSRPSSSVITTCQVHSVRPRLIGVATPVTMPERAARWWVALISMPTATRAGPACRRCRTTRGSRPATTDAPPCRRPYGWVLPSTGMVATTRSGDHSVRTIPRRSTRVPADIEAPGRASSGWAVRPCVDPSESARRHRRGRRSARTRLTAVTSDRPTLAPPRRPLAGLPRVLRAARSRTSRRPPGRRPTRSTASPSMLINALRDEQPTHLAVAFDLLAAVLPHRGVPGLQGQPLAVADGVRRAGEPHPGGARRAAGPGGDGRGLRGRRRHRHAHGPGRGGGHGRRRSSPATATPSSWSATTSRCSTRSAGSARWAATTRRGRAGEVRR